MVYVLAILGYLWIGFCASVALDYDQMVTFFVAMFLWPFFVGFGFTIKVIRALAVEEYSFLGGKR